MTKILCVANTAFFIYNYLLVVMKVLRTEGLEIVLVAPEDEYILLLEAEGFRCMPIKKLDRKGANAFRDLELMLELYEIYNMERPDLVLHYTIKVNVYGTFAAKLAKTDSVCTVSGLGWLFTEKSIKTIIGGFLYKILYKIAFSIALNVVFQNRYDQAFFIENRLVNKDKVFLTPGPGVDTGYFCPEQCKDISKNRDKCIFLLMARMLWDKGIKEFAEAAKIVKKRFPFAEFWLIGPIDKENRAAIPEDVIKSWESEGIVQYLGKTTDVRPFLCECDVAVLPSYREGTASSLIEAMAVGKPVITTDAIGCREVVEDNKNGFLVPVKDERALSDAIMKYILLPQEEKNKMGKYSREKALNEFDKKIVIDIYRTIICNAAGPGN
ncbi:MAG: glycosyltransferase family 4 protein [Proteobacteria bacterium]|nr:glycosyltransferase family 4 protein [Pseudomonadota bacterium]